MIYTYRGFRYYRTWTDGIGYHWVVSYRGHKVPGLFRSAAEIVAFIDKDMFRGDQERIDRWMS